MNAFRLKQGQGQDLSDTSLPIFPLCVFPENYG